MQSTEDRLAYLEAKVEALGIEKVQLRFFAERVASTPMMAACVDMVMGLIKQETLTYRNAALEDFLLRQQAELQQRRRVRTDPSATHRCNW